VKKIAQWPLKIGQNVTQPKFCHFCENLYKNFGRPLVQLKTLAEVKKPAECRTIVQSGHPGRNLLLLLQLFTVRRENCAALAENMEMNF
jgi:hypothetical protein